MLHLDHIAIQERGRIQIYTDKKHRESTATSHDDHFKALDQRIRDWRRACNQLLSPIPSTSGVSPPEDKGDGKVKGSHNQSGVERAYNSRKRSMTPRSPLRSPSPRKRIRPAPSDREEDEEDQGLRRGNEDDEEQLSTPIAIAARRQEHPNLEEQRAHQQPDWNPSSIPFESVVLSRRPSRVSRSSQAASTTTSTSYASQTRNSSPSKGGNRQKRVILRYTDPPFLSGILLDNSSSYNRQGSTTTALPNQIPQAIATIVRDLSEGIAMYECIPSHFKTPIAEYSSGTEFIPDEAYTSEHRHQNQPRPRAPTFESVSHIYEMADKTYRAHSDETAWYPILSSILNTISSDNDPSSLLALNWGQTQSVCTELLPRAGGVPISTVKTDFLLQLDSDNLDVSSVLTSLFRVQPNLSLSAFNDPVASKTFTAAIIEVKSPGGDFDEGVYQFTVASAAILARLRTFPTKSPDTIDQHLQAPAFDRAIMPVVGWVVHGHFWYFHVAFQQPDSSVIANLD